MALGVLAANRRRQLPSLSPVKSMDERAERRPARSPAPSSRIAYEAEIILAQVSGCRSPGMNRSGSDIRRRRPLDRPSRDADPKRSFR